MGRVRLGAGEAGAAAAGRRAGAATLCVVPSSYASILGMCSARRAHLPLSDTS